VRLGVDLINIFDEVQELREGSGINDGAPRQLVGTSNGNWHPGYSQSWASANFSYKYLYI
jgi:hypothetical protein